VPEGISTVHGHSAGRHRSASSNGTGKLATKIGLCLCAGQLITGPLLASAAEAAPVTAKATPAVTPKVTETVDHTRIARGALVHVTVRVVNPKTGKGVTSGKVALQSAGKGFHTWVTRSVNRNGVASFRVRPGATLKLRAAYRGTAVVRARISNVIRIAVVQPAKGARVLAEAKRHVGALYKYGAAGPKRFDCSGFTEYVYKRSVHVKLPHKANSQQHYGHAVSKKSAKVGDLIVFRSGSYGYHAAIYAGGGYMYDSPHSGARIKK